LVFRRQLQHSDLFLNASLELPCNMMRALERHPAVPAPTVIGIETDSSVIGSPFLVMENLTGRIVDQVPNYNVQGWVADLAPSQRRTLWLNAIRTIAALHSLDWRDGFAFLDDPARGAPGLSQYLDWVRDWYLRFSDRLVEAGRMPAGTDVLTNNPSTAVMADILGLPVPRTGEGFALMLGGMAGAGAVTAASDRRPP
jgi:aminoglycoside phosphotransferase (APT) family kinase protein